MTVDLETFMRYVWDKFRDSFQLYNEYLLSDEESLERIYFTFVRPNWSMVFTFGMTVLKGRGDRVEDFQLAIPRIVTGARNGTNYDLFTSRPFLKNGGRYCFGVRRRIRCPRRIRGCFALYLGCY